MTDTTAADGYSRALHRHYADVRSRLRNPPPRKRDNEPTPEPGARSDRGYVFVPRLIHEADQLAPEPIPVRDIIDGVCAFYPVSSVDILSDRHTQKIVRPRHIAMYLARTMTLRSLPHLGRCFNRDHTSIKHAVDKMIVCLADDQELAERVAAIRKHIEARRGVSKPVNDNWKMQ